MSRQLLTIAIPTYNRADCLSRLLDMLHMELLGLDELVSVLVSDNASTDRTPNVVAEFAAKWPNLRTLRNAENLGMDGNFIVCVEQVQTEYFWILGDDDLPRSGVVRLLLPLIKNKSPDLVYMNSQWVPEVTKSCSSDPVQVLQGVRLEQLAFARRVHVWTTYLSGMVVRTTPLLQNSKLLRRYAGTQVSQLAWVLEALRDGRCFVHVITPCILATQGNTGGYKVLKVFGQHVPSIMHEMLPAKVVSTMLLRMAVNFLPQLLWGLREARMGQFEHEDATEVLRPQFGGMMVFHWLLMPIGHDPINKARFALTIARQLQRKLRLYDLLAERLTGSLKNL